MKIYESMANKQKLLCTLLTKLSEWAFKFYWTEDTATIVMKVSENSSINRNQEKRTGFRVHVLRTLSAG